MPGYSQTPLAQKLGIREGATLTVIRPPRAYAEWLAPLPADVRVTEREPRTPTAVHLFTTRRRDLERELARWRQKLAADGFLWISWPKKASAVESDVTEDVIRELALPLGFVDVKVCAVSEIWSGLKLVIRKELRER